MLKKILKLVSEEEVISQRKISKYLNISLGSVNKYLNQALLLCFASELIMFCHLNLKQNPL